MKAVAYIRVSTKEQDEHVQIAEINKFAGERGIKIVKWYIDKGESGAKSFKDRPEAQALLNDLETIKPDAVVVYAIDRIGRTMLDTINTISELEKRGIKVISVKEQWLQTLDDNVRQLILSILSWVAEFERNRIKERRESAWASGKQKGRPRKVPNSTIEHYLKRYAGAGLSLRAIWMILRQSGYDISYTTFLRRAKELGYVKKIIRGVV